MKQSGIHRGGLAQLGRRGGMSGLPIIVPEKVAWYVQAIRGGNVPSVLPVEESNSSFVNPGTKEVHLRTNFPTNPRLWKWKWMWRTAQDFPPMIPSAPLKEHYRM